MNLLDYQKSKLEIIEKISNLEENDLTLKEFLDLNHYNNIFLLDEEINVVSFGLLNKHCIQNIDKSIISKEILNEVIYVGQFDKDFFAYMNNDIFNDIEINIDFILNLIIHYYDSTNLDIYFKGMNSLLLDKEEFWLKLINILKEQQRVELDRHSVELDVIFSYVPNRFLEDLDFCLELAQVPFLDISIVDSKILTNIEFIKKSIYFDPERFEILPNIFKENKEIVLSLLQFPKRNNEFDYLNAIPKKLLKDKDILKALLDIEEIRFEDIDNSISYGNENLYLSNIREIFNDSFIPSEFQTDELFTKVKLKSLNHISYLKLKEININGAILNKNNIIQYLYDLEQELKENKDHSSLKGIVLELSKNGFNFIYLPEEFLDDKDFILNILDTRKNVLLDEPISLGFGGGGHIFYKLSDNLKNDRDIVVKSVINSKGIIYSCLNDEFREDKEIALEAITYKVNNYEVLPKSLETNKEFWQELICKDFKYLDLVPSEDFFDDELLEKVINSEYVNCIDDLKEYMKITDIWYLKILNKSIYNLDESKTFNIAYDLLINDFNNLIYLKDFINKNKTFIDGLIEDYSSKVLEVLLNNRDLLMIDNVAISILNEDIILLDFLPSELKNDKEIINHFYSLANNGDKKYIEQEFAEILEIK